jgi:hypothetical protein
VTSKELNDAIREVCDRDDLQIEGGKCIPYIGWYWREVDFDAETARFGVIPPEEEGGAPFVGFMENNKWDYDYTRETTPEEWKEIKDLLEVTVKNSTKNTTQAVWDAIHKIARKAT